MQKDFVIKAKHAVKRVAAISAGATLMGATMMGAVAADLSDYPAPFVTDGQLNGIVVVGATADMADMIGAGDIIATLTQATVTTGTSSTTTIGGKSDEVTLGLDVDSALDSSPYTDSEIDGLIDGTIEFNDTDYDVHEALTFDTNLDVAISIGDDSEYGSNIYLETEDEGAFNYYFVFDEAFTANPTVAEPLKLNILGKDIRITAWATDNKFTLRAGTEAVLAQGESIEVDGKMVTIDTIGETTVAVTVDGETEFLSADDTEEIGSSGIEVEIEDILYTDDADSRAVMVFVGTDVSEEVTHGDSMELFGEPEEEADAEWIWYVDKTDNGNVAGSGTNMPVIGATHNQEWNDADDDMIGVGGRITLPNDYGYVELTGTTDVEYATYTISFDDSFDTEDENNVPVIKLSSNLDDEGFTIVDGTTHNVDTIYIRSGTASAAASFTYIDSDNDAQDVAITGENTSETQVNIKFGDTDWNLGTTQLLNVTKTIFIEDATSGNITITVTQAVDAEGYLGTTAETAETAELDVGGTDIGTEDEDQRNSYGVIFMNPDSNGDNDKVEFMVPDDQIEATVTLAGPGASVTTATESVTVNTVAGQKIISLDSDVSDPTATNMILVGGPAVNSLTAKALGLAFPTSGAASTVPEGAAMLKYVEDAFGGSNVVLIVAGWEKAETAAAASVLSQYATGSLSGDYQVVGTPSTAAVGGEATTE